MVERTEERTSASLSPERERALWALCRSGDANAREELIVAYRPLVFWVAGRIHAAPSLRQDLVQEGMLAMIGAVDRFDPDRDLKFATYACHRIRGQMLNMLERSERRAPVPVPDEWLEVAPAPGDEDWLDVAEIIGRLPVICTLETLDEDALLRILTEPINAPVRQYEKLLAMDGVELVFTEDALRAVAKKAIERKTGARSLKGIIEEVMLDVMFDIPRESAPRRVTVTRECITEGAAPIIENAAAG